ncbi:MAG: dihydroorotate dehydrogenase [Candidatus Omnitrophica bacterium]|nr:dihydroorotate dehydrogenase [Candidatus Omnitrophota bacterium]
MNLSVGIGKLKLKNPVMAASGTWGFEYGELADIDRLGAVVLKTITLKKRVGNPPPRIYETASGMLNSIGLENGGLDDMIENKLPKLDGAGTRVIVSIAGDTKDDFKKLAARLSKCRRVDALELNLSCPNVVHGVDEGLFAHSEKAVYGIVKAVREATPLTVITKLSPNVTDVKIFAAAAEAGGSDAIALCNTFIGMAIDAETMRPRLGNIIGGLSGPAIKPLSLRAVWEAAKAVDIPIVGIGGIMGWRDAVEFMLSGAAAVQVGTANFVDPRSPAEIVRGLEKYLSKHKIGDVRKLVGAIKLG